MNVLFFIVGMGFGTSYSIAHVDCLDWVHTRVWKRLLRGVIGCGITIAVFILLRMIHSLDTGTIFMMHHMVPALFFSLFNYGWYPLICSKIGLVDTVPHDNHDLNDPNIRRQLTVLSRTLQIDNR